MKLATHTESGYERADFDLYPTEAWVTRALLRSYRLRGFVWEPAAGKGDMVRVLQAAGHEVWATDIHNHGFDGLGDVQDFLITPRLPPSAQVSIVTNPPFGPRGKTAEAFCRHAISQIAHCGGIAAMLLRVDFDSAKTRADIFGACPHFAAKIVLTDRPRWKETREAGDASPQKNYAWFVWDALTEGPPAIRYAGNDGADDAR